MEIKIGIRPSPLARKQAFEALPVLKGLYRDARFVLRVITTTGDKDRATPLSEVEGSDFFTREIDEALLNGDIDVAVHSAKDVPEVLAAGLEVLAQTAALSPFDALVSRGNLKLALLPPASRVGTSSSRRKQELLVLRPDLTLVDIRGNIGERIGLVDSGSIDALVVAHAALIRLGLEYRVAEVFPLDIFQAHSHQGRLAIVGRKRL